MSRLVQKIWLVAVAVCCLSACEKSALSEDGEELIAGEANSMLQVRTRSVTGEGASVSYPVNVYVFSGEKCVALQTIGSEDETLSVPLMEGTYSVYAVGGASSDDYDLPTMADATPSMAIALKEGKQHGNLMVAKSSVVLVNGGTNTLTLALERKVMLLQSVVLQHIPSTATAVSVTITPLWERLEGTGYVGEEGVATIALTKQTDGQTWQFSGERYLLPPSANPATIAVNIVKPEGTSSYTYNTSDQLEAGYKINIQGTYTEAVGVTLTGTIQGAAAWGERTISFMFNESGSQVADDDTGSGDASGDVHTGSIPEVGSTYLGCYVVSVTENAGGAEVVLLSPTQKTAGLVDREEQASAMAKVEAALPDCAVDGINGWRLMTKAEARVIHDAPAGTVPNKNSTNRYLFDDNGTIKAVKMGSGDFTPTSNLSSTDILRPVATIQVSAE